MGEENKHRGALECLTERSGCYHNQRKASAITGGVPNGSNNTHFELCREHKNETAWPDRTDLAMQGGLSNVAPMFLHRDNCNIIDAKGRINDPKHWFGGIHLIVDLEVGRGRESRKWKWLLGQIGTNLN